MKAPRPRARPKTAVFRNKVFFLSNFNLCSVALESSEEKSSALLTEAAHTVVLCRPGRIPFWKGICWILGLAWGASIYIDREFLHRSQVFLESDMSVYYV